MPPESIQIVPAHAPEFIATVRGLFLEYADWLKVDLCFQSFDEELHTLPGDYAPPSGRLYLATIDGQTAGCIGLRKFAHGICEMKRLYVRKQCRGNNLGRLLIEQITDDAEQIGYHAMRLDTLPLMGTAIGLYRALGFKEVTPYRHNPVGGALFFERELSPTR